MSTFLKPYRKSDPIGGISSKNDYLNTWSTIDLETLLSRRRRRRRSRRRSRGGFLTFYMI